jgi:hypothetical protein
MCVSVGWGGGVVAGGGVDRFVCVEGVVRADCWQLCSAPGADPSCCTSCQGLDPQNKGRGWQVVP